MQHLINLDRFEQSNNIQETLGAKKEIFDEIKKRMKKLREEGKSVQQAFIAALKEYFDEADSVEDTFFVGFYFGMTYREIIDSLDMAWDQHMKEEQRENTRFYYK